MTVGRRILLSITTIGKTESLWRDKIAEIEPLSLQEVGLFLTGLSRADRTECFRLLEGVRERWKFSIPFVHAVADMHEEEYLYLMRTFETVQFNLHPVSEFPLEHPLTDTVRECIAIENNMITHSLEARDLEGFNGVCLDLSHLEDLRLRDVGEFAKMEELLATQSVRVNHLSAVWEVSKVDMKGISTFHRHVSRSPDDMNYLCRYPTSYFAPFCALELENSLAEQLEVARVVREIVSGG